MARRTARGANEGAVEREHVRLAAREGVGVEFLHRGANLNGGGGGRHGLAEADGDPIGDAPRQLPEKAAALKAEDATPYTVEVDRDDGRVDAFHDALEPATEGQQLACAGDLAFREDADDLAIAQRVAGGLQ